MVFLRKQAPRLVHGRDRICRLDHRHRRLGTIFEKPIRHLSCRSRVTEIDVLQCHANVGRKLLSEELLKEKARAVVSEKSQHLVHKFAWTSVPKPSQA